MTELTPWTRAAVLLRSFAIQGSWNYRTLLGGGFAFALLPMLERLYAGRPEELQSAVRRHCGLFNSHPYMAPVALGAVAEMERTGVDPALIERFKAAVRGSLGTLGDRLVWAAWRPVCALAALVLVLVGAPWWLAVAAFLVLYNVGHVVLRVWAFDLGARSVHRVGHDLRQSWLGPAQRVLSMIGGFLLGVTIPLAAAGGLAGIELPVGWTVAAAVGAVVGAANGPRVREPLVLALVAVAFIGLIMGAVE